ncbi:unnamed protein product [Brassica oleracea]|nr:PREDICTED: delta(24)-sterol reductase-like [Brassica oleracea var. oleracea]VDD60186.1 unnamed protein product [Brassica oleracea]
MKEMYQQLSVVPLVKNILLQTTTWNNLEAHYVKAIIRNFYANDVINGLFHLNVAAGGVHKESAYLYGVLLLCARIDGRWRVYPLWLCPHKLFKQPVKSMISPEPGFEYEMRQGDTKDAQMYTDVGVYYAPGPVLRGEVFDGVEAVRKMEQWLIEKHGYQPQYAVSELDERSFWRMFDVDLYEHCRRKYRAIGTFMSIYYKSKKGRKTEKEVREAEQAHLEAAYAEGD